MSNRKTLLFFFGLLAAGVGSASAEGLNIVEMFIAGGWVMYPILVLSLVSWGITFERLVVVFLQKYRMSQVKFLSDFETSLKNNGNDKEKTADEMLVWLAKKKGVCAELLRVALHKFKDGTAKNMTPLELRQWMTTAVESAASSQIPRLEKNLLALAVISNVATLMGLFGTVVGMIESFTSMSKAAGGVKADEMAGGIAVALVATAGGLVVAVPSLILYNWIKAFIENFVVQIDETVTLVTDTLVS